jgi:large subunit ribosomal protein L30
MYVPLRQELFKSRLAITLIRSTIGQNERQRRIVGVLGLKKLHRTRVHSDGPRVWGLIEKVTHLVKVTRVPATEEEQLAAKTRYESQRAPSDMAPSGESAMDLPSSSHVLSRPPTTPELY